MQMPHVQTCDMTDCDYNKHRQCHAVAITVGDEENPMCDTFWTTKGAKTKAGDPTQMGHVGACHMSQCLYNDRLQCASEGVTVGRKEQSPMCLTFNIEQ